MGAQHSFAGRTDIRTNPEEIVRKRAELFLKKVIREYNFYKEETYRDFINTICSAFNDVNDTPSPLLYDLFGGDDTETKFAKDQLKKGFVNTINTFTKPGRPNFGPKCKMGVLLFVFCTQSVIDLARTLYALCIVLGKTPEALDLGWVKDLKNPLSFTDRTGFTEEYYKRLSDYNERMHHPTSEEPNFYGVNIYQLIYPLMNRIDAFLDSLEGRRIELGGDGMFAPIKNFIERLQKWITWVDTVIESIQDVISIIEGFLMLSQVAMLKFTTNDGTEGVVQTLQNATGFYDHNVYNTKLKEMGFDIYIDENNGMAKRSANIP
jgi:hypothetical protein